METLYQDLRFGLRTLLKNRGFTTVATITLALGIGANSAIFSVVYAVLLKPLAMLNSERVVMVWEKTRAPDYQNDRESPSPGDFTDWKNRSQVFEDMGAILYRSLSLTASGEPIRIEGEAVSAGFFSVLKVNPLLGRPFTEQEDQPGGPRVVLLSHRLWVSQFAGDPGIVGRSIRLNDESYTVLGVMPQEFSFPDPDDVFWIPLGLGPEAKANHGNRYLRVIARLRPNVTRSTAQARMNEIAARLAEEYPSTNTGIGIRLVSLRDQMVGDFRPALLVLMGAVALTLLIACANITNLLLARSGARRGEFAIRAAIGARRTRLVRQLLTESLVLSLIGAAVGILLALEGVRSLQWLAPPDLVGTAKMGLNAPVLMFTLGIALVAGLIFGAAPAFQITRSDISGALKETSRSILSRSQGITRGMLVIGETALGVVVVVGSVLLARSFERLQAVPLGFQPEGVLTMRVILPAAKYGEMAQVTAFYQEAIRRIQAVPGVQSAGAITFLPLTLVSNNYSLVIEGREPTSYDQNPVADQRVVTPGYFPAIGMPLINGKDFSWSDGPRSVPVAMVSQSLVRNFWQGQDPIGKRLQVGPAGSPGPWLTVIGVVSDVSYFDLATPPQPTVYRPLPQNGDPRSGLRELAIRTTGNPLALAPAVRDAIWSIDNDLPVDRVRTMDQVRSISVEPRRFNLLLLSLFACLAFVLATVGLYGVTAYSAAGRAHEIAIRVSFGALPRDIILMVLRQGLWLAVAGVATGSLLALGFSGMMTRLVFGVSATDPVTFVIAAATLLIVDLVACYIPARRATRTDPIDALRCQ